jgi:hypothetical protein
MYGLIGIALCVLCGVMIRVQGISALLWTPIGFVIGLFVTSQIILPLLLGIPRAVKFVHRGEMRPAVLGRIIITPVLWLILLPVVLIGAGFFWPSAAERLYNNLALNLSTNLGALAIILSPLSRKIRLDFNADFGKNYGGFYRTPR